MFGLLVQIHRIVLRSSRVGHQGFSSKEISSWESWKLGKHEEGGFTVGLFKSQSKTALRTVPP